MMITKLEKTIIPQTSDGWKFADEYESRLRAQGCFRDRKEDTQAIIIDAEYHFSISDIKEGE